MNVQFKLAVMLAKSGVIYRYFAEETTLNESIAMYKSYGDYLTHSVYEFKEKR